MPPRPAKKVAPAAPPALDGCKIAFSGQFAGTSQSALKATAEGAGATVSSNVTNDTTHLVTTETDYNKNSAKVAKAHALNTPIVSLEWLSVSAQNNSRQAENDYTFGSASQDDQDSSQANVAKTNSQPDGAATNGRKTRKRTAPPVAADPSDDDAAPKPKKSRGSKAAASADDTEDIPAKDADGKKKVAKQKKDASPAPAIGEGQILKRNDILIPLDEGCPLVNSTVYVGDDGVIFDASLNQTNSSHNNNKFYRIQLLREPSGSYKTWTRWGRVGDRGQTAILGAGTLADAMRQFEKKFRDKSGLAWSQRGENPKSGKYAFVERSYNVDSDSEEEEVDDVKGKKADEWKPPPPSTLHPDVQKLMQLIFNQHFFAAAMTALNYDANKLPLGKLSKATITRGFQALKDLSALIDDQTLAANYDMPYFQAVEHLSNTFYSVIPHAFGRNRPPIIRDEGMLKKEVELLESLSDMKDAALIMKLDKKGVDDIHPLDRQFQGLKLDEMTPLDPASTEFTHLKDYLMNTRGSTHTANYKIESIFRIERQGELDRLKQSKFSQPTKNRRLLWHGSRATNFGGILSQGLRIAPPEAPVTGYMFDKGIYLADMSSKSAGYCYSHVSDGTALLLLCEAELGDPMQELTNSSYNAASTAVAGGMHSTWGKGNTGPLKWKDASCVHSNLAGVNMPDTTIPPGPTNVPGACLYYNEYIAYDISQVALRYLFRVKM